MTDILTNTVHVPQPTVKSSNDTFTINDKVIQQLLNKLDEGTETIMNLRSLLTHKTAELNELVRQLELIDQVLVNVEHGTEQIELVLKDVISAGDKQLLHAEATLDSAIKSACNLYLIDSTPHYYQQQKRMTIVNKVNSLLNQLNIDTSIFWNDKSSVDDIEVLQKVLIDLDLAKNIASTIKNDAKHRSTILKNNKSSISLDQIKKMGDRIRNQVQLYQSYTRNASSLLLLNNSNKQDDILAILDREDEIISKRIAMQHNHNNHISPRQQQNNNNIATVSIATTTKKKRQSTIVHNNNNVHNNKNKSTTKSSTTTSNYNLNKALPPTPPPTATKQHTNSINKQTMSLLLLSRHTSSSKAKSKEPKRPQLNEQQQQQRGPGSTLRLRNMLAKRNPSSALKINNGVITMGSTTTVVC